MGFKLKVGVQLAALMVITLLLGWTVASTTYYATMVALSLVLLAQLAALWRTLTTTNRELTRFLTAISHNDFTQTFRPVAGDGGFHELGQAFESIAERFRAARSDKELQAAYLSAFVERLPTAVMALDEEGRILHSNSALRELLDLPAAPPTLERIRQQHPQLAEALEALHPNQIRQLRLAGDEGPRDLTLACTILRSRGQQQKLVTLQNIRAALDAQELIAWQNLIRVMTHEIMNSITPITSLAGTAQQCLEESRTHDAVREDAQLDALLEDVGSAVTTIGNRGQGLMRFVDSYRRLSRLPTPMPRDFGVMNLFMQVRRLVEPQLGQVELTLRCAPDLLELHADQEQLEQALLNLVNNAIDALAGVDSPTLLLEALAASGRVTLRVVDNGCGMTSEQLEQVFVPFFTTKRGGNGIGMSIVRQIVHLNGGRIDVHSTPGAGTRVTLSF